MSPSFSRLKCLGCKELFLPSPCNRGRQRFCAREDCRKASKAASQSRWSQQPRNRDYFRGAAHVERVRQWRAQNPGYTRRKKQEARLQDFAPPQAAPAEPLAKSAPRHPPEGARREPEVLAPSGASAPRLQDFVLTQDPLFVGLISSLAGAALQESLVPFTHRLVEQGRRVLAQNPHALGRSQATTPCHSR